MTMAKRRLSRLLSAVPRDEKLDGDLERSKESDRLIKDLNRLSSNDFKTKYISNDDLRPSLRESFDGDAPDVSIAFKTSSELAPDEVNACLDLISSTSLAHYKESSFGWNPRRKKREMKEDEMRYLLVRTTSNIESKDPGRSQSANEGEIQGFLSFMLTHDSTPPVPVLYVYEIHLLPHLRKFGLGAHLMRVAEDIAAATGMEKVMLTCFVANERAYEFYKRRAYEKDVCTPKDRITRKKIVKADYVIMSRVVR